MLVPNIASLPLNASEQFESPARIQTPGQTAGAPTQATPAARPGGLTSEEAGAALDSARGLMASGTNGMLSVHQIDQSRLAALLAD